AEVRPTAHRFQASVSTFEAAIAWDPQAGSIAAAELSFDLAALTTGHPRRDREMLRWLDAETHPRARFRLIELEQIDDGLLAHGRFLLHGREQPLTLRLALSGQADTLGVEGTATLDHRDWDLPRIRTLLVMTVDPVLKVHFSLQASLPEGHTIANRE
ncbi:MAG: YceI family protein, partial [Puniceicoccaceae bacterium]